MPCRGRGFGRLIGREQGGAGVKGNLSARRPLSGATRSSNMSKADFTRPRRQGTSEPPADQPPPLDLWRRPAHVASLGIFLILLIAALSLARPILLPAVSAFVLMLMLGPLSAHAERLGVPNVATDIALWLLVLVVFYGVILLLAAPAVEWIGRAPDIGRSIEQKIHVIDAPLGALQQLRNALLPGDSHGSLGVDIAAFVRPLVDIVVPGIGQMLVFLGTLFFMLLGRGHIRRTLVGSFRSRDAKLQVLKILNEAEHD